MIRLVKREEIDDKAWDRCIASSLRPLVYANSWYLDIVCEQWEGIVFQEILGSYSLVLPIPIMTKWNRPFVRMPLFCQQLGVFASTDCSLQIQKKAIETFVKHYRYINPYVFADNSFDTLNLNRLEVTTNFELACLLYTSDAADD